MPGPLSMMVRTASPSRWDDSIRISPCGSVYFAALVRIFATHCSSRAGSAFTLAGQPGCELYRFTRLVSRWVYILMYVLAMVRGGLYLFDANNIHLGHGSHHPVTPVRSLNDFQFYVACCIIPLWLVRAVVLTSPLKQRNGSPACCDSS